MKSLTLLSLAIPAFLSLISPAAAGRHHGIDRKKVVSKYNPERTADSDETPMQVGNGDFAFGADITGLQTTRPFAIMSSWGWHNVSLPNVPGQTEIDDFTGLDWWTHGRLVNYNQPSPAQPNISQWLISNPHRLNLGRIGFLYKGKNVSDDDLADKQQKLDLYSGVISSRFTLSSRRVEVTTAVDPNSDTVSVEVKSYFIQSGDLTVFFDYPYAIGDSKFEAPFVGIWDQESKHKTELVKHRGGNSAQIKHELDATTYYTTINWQGRGGISRQSHCSHRYILEPGRGQTLKFTTTFSTSHKAETHSVDVIRRASGKWWRDYWQRGGFIDMTAVKDERAAEIQRRVILSQYLVAVNGAGRDPPQESGLVNNGWYGKFHMEMYLWHHLHWTRWDKVDLLERSVNVYERFLPASIVRAEDQGYKGARWGKMSDPAGRSAPGEINSLLIWQQPHILYFAEEEYRRDPSDKTLKRWDHLLEQTAEFMTSYAFWNESTNVYDLGPPMYPASENTNPNATINPTFELAYWRFGLDIAMKWRSRQDLPVPENWKHVAENLALLPVTNDLYDLYEGIPDMWKPNTTTIMDHPALTAAYGLLPPTPGLNTTIMKSTAELIWEIWNFPDCWGWDFPMLSMNALRLGDRERAVDMLLHDNFQFDDVGMPIGGLRVPTPYFPASGSLLISVALMASGWDGDEGMKFPRAWNNVRVEGFRPAM
ncbi:hypothetical protein AJ80_02922 [Polytolypa hystricis UAMH7299]|uniref:Six-hairpin glycosidase-like protein n=1 Tax=Polytolypa hystricis (strain UAMH7299) TaxID=1447883 RepID=A0A2B7YQT4_POLH7|nr:hypothetical protein AJ80_02922 [Polytolypa hystricis UAMH7299]